MKCKFGEIATGFDYGMNAAAKPYDGQNKYIRITDIDEASSTYNNSSIVSPDGILSENYVVNEGDILLARTGASTGKSYLYRKSDGKLYYAGFLIRANVAEHNPYFVFSQLHTHRYWRWVSIMSARSGQPGINSLEYASFPIFTTTLKEENKISSLLSLIDERITTQNKIIEDLKKLKSAICEKLFSSPKDKQPQIRLYGFFGDWHFVRLSDICHRICRKNTGEQCKQVLTIAAQYGLVSQEEFFNKNVASENLSGYYLLQKGDFAYNKSYSGDYVWGTVKRLDNYEQGVLSPLYICFRPDPARVDSDFLIYYFESKKWHKTVSFVPPFFYYLHCFKNPSMNIFINLSVVDYFNTIHCIPSMDEQKQIAQIIGTLLSKIAREQRMLNCYAAQRQYLLRQMFI